MSDSQTVEELQAQLAGFREKLGQLLAFVDETDGWTAGLPLAHVPNQEPTQLADFVAAKIRGSEGKPWMTEFELWMQMVSSKLAEASQAMLKARQSTSEFLPLFAYPVGWRATQSLAQWDEYWDESRQIGTVRWFGPAITGPISNPLARIEFPGPRPCGYCSEFIAPAEFGVRVPRGDLRPPEDPFSYFHRNCFLDAMGIMDQREPDHS